MQRMSMKIYKHIVSDINNYLSNLYALTRASLVSSVLFMKCAFYVLNCRKITCSKIY